MKVQVQLYGDDFNTKYTSFYADVVPSIGHTLTFNNNRFEVKSVTWMLSIDPYQEQNEVHVSAKIFGPA
jgi:hypothetical protein